MTKGILGRKLGMTQVFEPDGRVIPVTVVEAGPCVVVQKKSLARDGYDAVQLGFGDVKEKKVTRPLQGHFKKNGIKPRRILREVLFDNMAELQPGQEIRADIFKPGEKVDVVGRSKGKGFAGTVKRYHFGRGPMTHGSKYHRGPGSLSASSFPSHVFRGRKLPGHMGAARVTTQGLEVVRVDADRNLLLIRGSVPGPKGGYVIVKSSLKG